MWALITSLVIPLLILGPLFPDLIVSLSSLVFLIYVVRYKLFFYFNKKPLIIFFIFCAYCIFVSIFVEEDIFFSFESSLFYFRIGLFSCVIWYLIEQDKKILNYFYYALLISFSALVIDGYIQFFSGYNLIGLSKSGARISSFFGTELIMGSYLSRLFPLLFALYLLKKKKSNRVIFCKYIIYFVGWFNLYFRGKGCFLSLYFIICIYYDFFRKIYKIKNNIISFFSNLNYSFNI